MGLIAMYLPLALYSTWMWILLGIILLFWCYMRKFIGFYDTSMARTDDKTFVITGAESGVAKEACDLLSARGGRIIMACKDTKLGEASKAEIAKRTLNDKLEVRHLDMSSLASVRKFSAELHSCTDHVDALVLHSTPECAPASTTTADGLNSIMQQQHFSPFLLANLMLDLLKKSPQGRIVFVSSIIHHFNKFSLDNLNCESEPLPNCRVYCNAKLANILTAKYLARILRGTGVTVNSVHPGCLKPTTTSNASCSVSFLGMICNLYLKLLGKTAKEGAMTPIYVASDPKLANVTGKHFADCKVSGCVASIANDVNVQDKLFEKSVQLVNLRPDEKYI